MSLLGGACRIAASVALAGALSVGTANSSTITVNGAGSETDTPLQAIFDISYVDMIDAFFRYSVTITNVDLGQIGDNILTGFALASNPSSTWEGDDSSFDYVVGDALEAGVTNTYDFCFEADTNGNCNGGPVADGLGEGESETFYLTVSAIEQPDFFGAAARWQSVGDGNEDSGTGMGVVPLPAAGWLLFGALGGLAVLRRRRAAS